MICASRVVVDGRMLGCSGIGTYIQNVVPRVAAAAQDWQFAVLGAEVNQPAVLGAANIAYRQWNAPIYSIREQISAPFQFSRDAEVLWVPHYNAPILHRGRLLVTVHDVFHLAAREFVRAGLKRAYARLMFAALRRNATKVICVSKFTASELMRCVGVPPSKIEVIPNGVDDFWRASCGSVSPLSEPYFLYVGNVKPHKNLSRLIVAFESIAGAIPHKLVIVGQRDGFITGDSQVELFAQRLGGRVVFTGKVEQDTLRNYYSHATALVFPSLYEGFGLPPLEAMASGCPVILSNVAALPEICGDAALYVDPYSVDDIARAMRLVANDGVLRMELRAKGIERVTGYHWGESAQQTLAVIRSMVMDGSSHQDGGGLSQCKSDKEAQPWKYASQFGSQKN